MNYFTGRQETINCILPLQHSTKGLGRWYLSLSPQWAFVFRWYHYIDSFRCKDDVQFYMMATADFTFFNLCVHCRNDLLVLETIESDINWNE